MLHARTDAPAFAALAAGCQVAGHSAAWQRPTLWSPADLDPRADVAVVFGAGGSAGVILDAYRSRGVECWIVDYPRLRAFAGEVGLYRNTLDWLPATGRPTRLPRLTARRAEVTLVIGQKPGDAAHGMDGAAMQSWLRGAVTFARAEAPDRPVVVRWHPQDRTKRPADAWGADGVSDPADESLDTPLATTACVVTYNSTVGWDAIVAGVPVSARSLNSVAYRPFVSESLAAPTILPPARRTEALSRARASQWSLAELADGTALRAMAAEMAA